MNSFLTGSRVYGTPRDDSDIDLVVVMDREQLVLLMQINSGKQDDDRQYEGASSAQLRFGKLNLLVFTDPVQAEAWKVATEKLKERAPVTRPEAVEAIKHEVNEAMKAKSTMTLDELLSV